MRSMPAILSRKGLNTETEDVHRLVRVHRMGFSLLGDMSVEDRNQSEEPPIISEPDDPQNVKDCPKAEPRPFIVVQLLQAHQSTLILQN